MERKSLFPTLMLCCAMICGALLMPACSFGMPPDPPGPIAVTPRDTSPDTLDVKVVIFEDQDATDRMTDITFSFSTIVIEEEPNYVLFDDPNEEVVCNGAHQPLGKSPSYKLRVPRGHYLCTYSGNSEDGNGNGKPLPPAQMFDIAPRSELSPQPPIITGNGFSDRYTPDPDDQCTIRGKATDSAGDPAVWGPSEPGNEGVYSGPNTSSLHGTGDLFLIRTCHWHPYQPGELHISEFHDMDVTYTSQASVEVTWSH